MSFSFSTLWHNLKVKVFFNKCIFHFSFSGGLGAQEHRSYRNYRDLELGNIADKGTIEIKIGTIWHDLGYFFLWLHLFLFLTGIHRAKVYKNNDKTTNSNLKIQAFGTVQLLQPWSKVQQLQPILGLSFLDEFEI